MMISKGRVSKFKKRLLSINDSEPLSKLSLVVILALDIFVVYIIFAGLSDHTSLLISQYEYVPDVCRQVIIEQEWTEEKRIDDLQYVILSNENSVSYNSYSYLDPSEIAKTHPLCNQLLSKIKVVNENKGLHEIFKERQTAQEKQSQLSDKFNVSKNVYDTNLLESIATDAKADKVLSVETSAKEISQELNRINQSIGESDLKISKTPSVRELWDYIDEAIQHKQQIIDDLRRFDFWYPIKVLAWQLVFLLPLCGIFYLWNDRSIKKNSNIQVLISSHLLAVSFIPVFFKIVEIVLDIIPKRLLEKLFNMLESLNIIAVWHYLIIFVSIVSAIIAIFVIQKKVFSKDKIMRKRLMKGACYRCGKKLPWESHHICPFCGEKQYAECAFCHESSYIAGEYCVNCGSQNWKSSDVIV